MVNFENYLGRLPFLTNVVKDRINDVIGMNMKIKDFDIKDIFVCELKNKEGSRNYTSLWLFTNEYFIECKDFLNKFDFDVCDNKVTYCSIESVKFDFENVDELSILKVHCLVNDMSCSLIATEQNCLSLFELYKKYIIANFVKNL